MRRATLPGEAVMANELTAAPAASAIAHLPVALFAAVMGVSGLGLVWRDAAGMWSMPSAIGETILILGAAIYGVLLLSYGVKMARYPAAVRAEFNDPVTGTFFPTFSIATMLLASAALPFAPGLARDLWLAGSGLTFVITLVIIRRWVLYGAALHHVTPQWFMPVVGNIVAPLAAPALGYTELGWFFFSVGLTFWIVLLTLIFYRLVFGERLPAVLRPTLFILLSPPAVAFSAYIALNGQIDGFARVLFFTAVLVALLLVSLARSFISLQFAATWWSFTFPCDAFAGAMLRYYAGTHAFAFGAAAVAALAVATVIVTLVAARTLTALYSGTLLQPQRWS
jgi:tellurite resistance protein